MIGVWAPLAATEPQARWIIGVHLAALALPIILIAAPRTLPPVVASFRNFYPLLFLWVFWKELGDHYGYVGSHLGDLMVRALDLRLFGQHLNLIWMPAMPETWFSELMYFFYLSYYVLLLVVPVALFLRRDKAITTDVILRLTVANLACFAVYACLPTVGPFHLFPAFKGALVKGALYQFNVATQVAGDALGTAFPSSHVAGAVTVAWLAQRYWGGWTGRALWVVTLCIALATVYTQNHFVIDSLTGALVGIGLQYALIPALPAALGALGGALVARAGASRVPDVVPSAEPEAS